MGLQCFDFIMENSTSVSEVIIWLSPLVGGLAIYLLHDAYSAIKDELKELKTKQYLTREEQAEHRAETRALLDNVNRLANSLDATSQVVSSLDKRSGDTREMSIYMKTLENKLNTHDANYGKVILILEKVISILKPKKPQPPRE